MRAGFIALALAAGAVWADSRKPAKGISLPRGCRDRGCVRERALGSAQAPLSVALEYSWAASGTLPTCTGDATCRFLCYVSTGTTWVCVDNTGANVGTIAQGTAPTAENTFAPSRIARSNVSDTTAPSGTGSVFDNIMAGDVTIIAGGIWHPNGATANSAFVSIASADINNVLSMHVGSGALSCTYGESGSFPIATVTAPLQGWAVVSQRRAGNVRTCRVNGTDGTPVSTAGTRAAGTTTTASFGRERPGAAGRNLAGPLAFVAGYSEAKSTTWLKTTENAFWGAISDTGGGSSGLLGLPDDAGTNVDFFAAGAHPVSPDRGLRTVGQVNDNIQALWAVDPFDVSSWTDVGTPLIGASSIANPFSRWQQAGGCYNLEDNSAAAFEGKESDELQRSTGAGAAHGWNVRVWASIGDAGTTRDRMRIALVSDGVFSVDAGAEVDCDFTLTNTVQPYDCVGYTTDAGVTTVKGRVLVGNTAATTGSVTVCNAQDTAHPWPQLSLANATAFGASDDSLSPATWPSTANRGKYEVVFTPLWDINGPQWDNNAGVLYLFDAFTAGPVHSVVFVGGYQMAGRFLARVTDSGGAATEFLLDGVSLTPWQRYAVAMEWEPTSSGCAVTFRMNSCAGAPSACFATVVVAGNPAGVCPDQPTGVNLGDRYDDTVPTSVFIDAVRVYQ
jgi:hypothetical protein